MSVIAVSLKYDTIGFPEYKTQLLDFYGKKLRFVSKNPILKWMKEICLIIGKTIFKHIY